MRADNLTKSQLELLDWMVQEVRAGRLDEEEIWFCWTYNGTSLVDYKGDTVPDVKLSTLEALRRNHCIVCSRSSSDDYKCALTGKAYKVVDELLGASDEVRILFLASDPCDSVRLRLSEESREIQEKLQLSRQRDRFTFETRGSVRPGDISQAMHDFSPSIVHFAGHGEKNGELCFENAVGKTQLVSPEALANLFELVSTQVDCVVLNACYSETQASAISRHIPFVIGMNSSIGDAAAIAFSTGFYKALGAGHSIKEAYKFACVEIQLEGITGHLTPVLKSQTDTALLLSKATSQN